MCVIVYCVCTDSLAVMYTPIMLQYARHAQTDKHGHGWCHTFNTILNSNHYITSYKVSVHSIRKVHADTKQVQKNVLISLNLDSTKSQAHTHTHNQLINLVSLHTHSHSNAPVRTFNMVLNRNNKWCKQDDCWFTNTHFSLTHSFTHLLWIN